VAGAIDGRADDQPPDKAADATRPPDDKHSRSSENGQKRSKIKVIHDSIGLA
jgi:hypothetical protein